MRSKSFLRFFVSVALTFCARVGVGQEPTYCDAAPVCNAVAIGGSQLIGDYHRPLLMAETCAGELVEPQWWTQADLLYWRPRMRSVDYAATEDGLSLTLGAGNTHRVELDRDAGFRISLGRMTKIGWGISFHYTDFSSDSAASVSRPAGVGQLFSTLSHPGGPEEADEASATNSLDYSTFDLLASTRLVDRQFKTLDVFAGVRWANIENDIRTTLDGRDFVNGVVSDTIDIDAFGFQFGGEGHIRLSRGWFLLGRTSVAVLYADVENTRAESNLNGAEQLVDFTDQYAEPLLNVETRIGVGKSIRNFDIRVGYDFSIWTGVGDRILFTDDIEEATHSVASGDLLLEGLFVQAGFVW